MVRRDDLAAESVAMFGKDSTDQCLRFHHLLAGIHLRWGSHGKYCRVRRLMGDQEWVQC